MSEKLPHEDNVQDTLFPDSSSEDEEIRAAVRRVVPLEEIMQDPEIIARLNESGDTWEELGGGNREEIVQEKLGDSLMKVLATFQAEYNPVQSREPFIYKLDQGLDLARRLADAGARVNIPSFVSGLIEQFNEEVEPTNDEVVKFFAEQCDASLAVLKNVMFRDIDDVIDRNPSPAWEKPELRNTLSEGIKTSLRVFQILRPKKQHEDNARYNAAIESYIQSLQDEFLTYTDVPKPSPSDTREKKVGRETAVKRRRLNVTSSIKSGRTTHNLQKPTNS